MIFGSRFASTAKKAGSIRRKISRLLGCRKPFKVNSGGIMNRRKLLATGFSAGVGFITAPLAVGLPLQAQVKLNPDEGVTAPEDLMKEHGVLNRCLLIYEEGIRRLKNTQEVSPNVFNHTAALIKKFVEQYHEKNEEKYIFPVFEKHGKLVDLVTTLKTQHKAGRVVTAGILHLSQPTEYKDPASREKLIAAIESFIRMYRPHEAREDTI